MTKELRFINLYCAVCHYYDNTLVAYAQRTSNNFCPKFSDEECIATLIWGIANQKFDVKRCHEFIKDYYGDWFPNLPSYQTYNKRICFLADAFKVLAGILLGTLYTVPLCQDKFFNFLNGLHPPLSLWRSQG